MIDLLIKYTLSTQILLGQVQLEGLEKAAETSPLNGALVGFIILLIAGIVMLWKQMDNSRKELKDINKSHTDKLEEIRKENLKREEERNKQWSDSEKETLQVLNSVTKILEMGEQKGHNDTKQILEKININDLNLESRHSTP